MMEFVNALSKYTQESDMNASFLKEALDDYLKLLAPFAPHFAEEQWSLLGNSYSIFNQSWPAFDPKALVKDEIEIAIQINGKIKAKINIASGLAEDAIKAESLANSQVVAAIDGKNVVKVIVIKGRLVNIVVK